jgi:hypothetical protein
VASTTFSFSGGFPLTVWMHLLLDDGVIVFDKEVSFEEGGSFRQIDNVRAEIRGFEMFLRLMMLLLLWSHSRLLRSASHEKHRNPRSRYQEYDTESDKDHFLAFLLRSSVRVSLFCFRWMRV